ncbi:MAG TPA: universal stress protein [Gaiellaceae bacterium]|jgi:APA family basic amino acid/polyamine antiporter|nr:universal stress protein [Gaiellaceae bacterium]
MARKLRGIERVLEAPALFAVAYGEIASSLYLALGIVAAAALGFTPLVLAAAGSLFFLVSLSYAEGTAALPEAGGAATFVRRAFSDLAGFVAGWALLLDFLIVMALSALFAPHYLAAALAAPTLRQDPWDALAGGTLIALVSAVRLVRRPRLHLGALAVALLDLVVQGVLVLLGLALVLSPETLADGLSFAHGQGVGDLAFALPLAMLAYTGLETVANLAEEAREPGRTLPGSLFSAIGLVVVVTVAIAAIGLSAYPVSGGETPLGEEWLEAPLVGIAAAFEGSLPDAAVGALRVAVGVSGALILLAAAASSSSGITRLTRSLAEHGSLPHELGRLERRALYSSEAIVASAVLAIGLIALTEVVAGGDPAFLAAIYSFGVLLAFTAAQLAVLWLRVQEPELARPFRARPNVAIRGVSLPLPALVGAPLTLAVWMLALVTHPGARYGGPLWLAGGLAVFALVRRSRRRGLLEQVVPVAKLPAGAELRRILVPMKLGDVGEEMVATAIALAKERGAEVEAITVVRVPRRYPLEGPLPADVAARVEASLAEARALGEDHGVEVRTDVVRARSIGHAIVEEARARAVDAILLGSSPRWRRQSRAFSPTVDYVLRRAPCQVLVVAFPEGVFET